MRTVNKLTNLTIDLKKRVVEEDYDKLLNPEFFELSREYIPCLVESSPYYILHKDRNLERALIKGKGVIGDFVSTTYILFPSDQISEIPRIITKSNFEVIHSKEELNLFWDNKIKKAEEEVLLLKRRKEYAIKNAKKINLPESNPQGFTQKTSLKEIKLELKDRNENNK